MQLGQVLSMAGPGGSHGIPVPSVSDRWWDDFGWPAAVLIGVVGLGLVAHAMLFALLERIAKASDTDVDDVLVVRLRRPTMLIPAVLALQFVVPLYAGDWGDVVGLLRHANAILLILLASWLGLAAIGAGVQIVLGRHDIDAADNLEARRIHTQLRVLRRVLSTIVVIVGAGAVLMTFPSIRQFGLSIVASAGLAGLVLGLAARPVLENLIAGVQVALAQPIRLDDVVVIDGEWGRIEEITTTYVVVRIWDQRRLIVPFSKILADSFQNWTRTSAEVLGTATVHVDYTTPVGRVREELERIVKGHEKWDGRVCVLQVTDAGETTMQLRALVSAKDSGSAWDLRCFVREGLVDFLRREMPEALPRTREIEYRVEGAADGERPAGGDA